MDFSFTEDQLAFRDAVRDLLENECDAAAVRAAWEAPSPWAPERWAQLAEMGVVGLLAGADVGGLALSDVDLVLLLEEAGRAALPEPLVETAAVAIPLLAEIDDPALADVIGSLAAGDELAALGLGTAPFVAGAADAGLVLMQDGDALVLFGPASGPAEPSVDRARRLVPREKVLAGPALHRFDDVGGALDRAGQRAATGTAAVLVGLARHLLSVTVDYATEREQFGQPIGGFQAVKHHLANALLAVEFAAPAVYRAAWTMAEGHDTASRDASMAKAMASDAATQTARAALQVHGAIGYTFEHDLHLWMKKVWALAPAFGDAAEHRRLVAEAVIG